MKRVLGLFALVSLLSGCATDFDRRMHEQNVAAGNDRSIGQIMQQGARDLNSINQGSQPTTCHIIDLGGGMYRQQCN